MTTGTVIVLILTAILVLGGIVCMTIYNRLVGLRQRVLNAFAQIDVQLKRRHDLVPNLVEAVKGYMVHERETLERVTQARNLAVTTLATTDPKQGTAVATLASAENELVAALKGLMILKEGYPQLKADANARQLMEELSSTENRVAFARQSYNDSVMLYNTARQKFPAVLLAGIMGFPEAQLFGIENASEREVVNVELG
ncbi:MAG TPA: LemA family protein [Tepidisphaeraceae bacterium]|jgi:LemA protein